MEFQKNSIALSISREMAVALGLAEPTQEERAEREKWSAAFKERKDAAAMHIGAAIRSLDALPDPVARAVLDHHARRESWGQWKCEGCDQGCSCDSPDWPCSTVVEVASVCGIDMTDADLFDRPKDGSLDLREEESTA